ncbi:hypothetical protein [Hyphomicrobium sp. D-2]|uniref:hypothetical protein n=1 Tax=Hyphomicrobium sp. D-2 TaxID=3041621 RepID=UPI0024553057|nr:hypothetical protein [Hyphomicrobium sp. D-2]MDH4981240.1 hypothetical protein [Hyphomicrobium sp. D-2]
MNDNDHDQDHDHDEEQAQQFIEGELSEIVGDHFEQGESTAVIGQALLSTMLDFIEKTASCPHEVALFFSAIQDEVHRRLELLVAQHQAQNAVKH